MPRAALIVIEGLDRSGKSTQTSLLNAHIESLGKRVKLLKFPDRTTPIGQMINSYLQSQSELDDHVIHLLFSANRWEFATSIEALLNAGTTVICDRYAFSGISFSASKGLSYEWCRSPDISLPAPDLTLFLDISPEKAKERGGYGEERYEKEQRQREVRVVFNRLAEEAVQDHGKWIQVDAGQGKDEVFAEMWTHVAPFLDGLNIPIQRLWLDKLSTVT